MGSTRALLVYDQTMNGIAIRGPQLRALRHQKRLSGAGLGAQIGRTTVQVYRVEKGLNTSLQFLDRLVPLFGTEAVAGLIVSAEQREIFTAAHKVPA